MKNQLITKTINNQTYTFRLVDGILIETTDSFLARGGAIDVYSENGKYLGERTLDNSNVLEFTPKFGPDNEPESAKVYQLKKKVS